MGAVLILLFVIYICTRKKDKKHYRHYSGKSDWEMEVEDGGKFFGW